MAWRLAWVVGMVALWAVPGHARAQEGHPLPAEGSYGISFNLPEGGGGGFGFRRMLSPRKSVGVDVTLGYSWQRTEDGGVSETRTFKGVGVGSDLRYYRRARGPVVPFLEVGGALGYSDPADDSWSTSLRGNFDLGVEWLPLDGMSISGSTGVGALWGHSKSQGRTHDDLVLNASRSVLQLTLYF